MAASKQTTHSVFEGTSRFYSASWLLLPLLCLLILARPAVADRPALLIEEEPAEEPADIDDAGFTLQLVEDEEREALAKITELLDQRDWANAFRMLTVLSEEQLRAISPTGDSRVYAPVRGQVQSRLISLDPEGLRAFRLYFDAQANELFDQVRRHPLPGSYDALTKLQQLLDRFYPTTVGAEAAALAGDLYFERGMFVRAERCWRMAVEHDQIAGPQRDALQVRRVLALLRVGDTAEAFDLFDQLRASYDELSMRVGGEQVDGLSMLGGMFDPKANINNAPKQENNEPALPTQDTQPVWQTKFLNPANQSRANAGSSRSYYRTPEDLRRFVPQVVADQQKVYFNWLEVVFALDRETGKIQWQTSYIKDTASQLPGRTTTNAGDPRNYNMTLADDVVLVTKPLLNNREPSFTLAALSKMTGQLIWSSQTRSDWGIDANGDASRQVSIIGEVAVAQGAAYAVIHRAGQADCFLRRFDPKTGAVDWTLKLGTATPIVFRYTQARRMPQPITLVNNDLLHVLVGGGILVTIDSPTGNIIWALQMDMPLDIELSKNGNRNYNAVADRIDNIRNPNGSGALVLHKGTLYAKQHLGDTLYAVNPRNGKVAWTKNALQHDAQLVGVDDQRVYLMDSIMRSYPLQEQKPAWDSSGSAGRPQHAGAIVGDERVMLFDGPALRLLDAKKGKPLGVFKPQGLLGTTGGNLYQFDDLLVCVDQTQITAFSLKSDTDQPEPQPAKP